MDRSGLEAEAKRYSYSSRINDQTQLSIGVWLELRNGNEHVVLRAQGEINSVSWKLETRKGESPIGDKHFEVYSLDILPVVRALGCCRSTGELPLRPTFFRAVKKTTIALAYSGAALGLVFVAVYVFANYF